MLWTKSGWWEKRGGRGELSLSKTQKRDCQKGGHLMWMAQQKDSPWINKTLGKLPTHGEGGGATKKTWGCCGKKIKKKHKGTGKKGVVKGGQYHIPSQYKLHNPLNRDNQPKRKFRGKKVSQRASWGKLLAYPSPVTTVPNACGQPRNMSRDPKKVRSKNPGKGWGPTGGNHRRTASKSKKKGEGSSGG